MIGLSSYIESRKSELERVLSEYERYKELAAVEVEKASPLIRELKERETKTLTFTLGLSLGMLVLGVLLSHFLRVWFPGFEF